MSLDRGFFCPSCERVVHDLSTLTHAETRALLRANQKGERICVQMDVRTSDGAILLADGYLSRRAPRHMLPVVKALATVGASLATACAPASSTLAPAISLPSTSEVSPSPVEDQTTTSSALPCEKEPETPPLPDPPVIKLNPRRVAKPPVAVPTPEPTPNRIHERRLGGLG